MAVGTAAPPSTRPEPPRTPPGQRYSTSITVVAGILAAAAAGAAQLIATRGVPQPASVAEATVAANSYGLVRLGGFQVPASLSDRVVSIHAALYDELTSAADRHAAAAGALRELLVVFVLAGALSLFTLCRQLGLRTPTAFGVVLLAYVAPAVAGAQVLLYATTIATSWLLVAAILLSARPSTPGLTWLARILAVALTALVTVIEPIAFLLPTGVIGVAVITGTLFPRWGARARVLAVAGVLLLLAVVGAATADTVRTAATAPVARSTALALAVAGLALAVILSWRVPWIRPLALGSVPLFAVAALPWAGQAPAAIVGLPVVAVLFGALVEEVVTGPRRPSPALLPTMVGGLIAAAVVGLLVLPGDTADAVESAAADDLASWLTTNTTPATRVQVDPLLWVDLVRAGVPAPRLQRTDSVVSGVSPPALVAARNGGNEDLPLVARFGAGTFAVDVRQAVTDAVATRTAILAERIASQSFGSALADNPNLTFDDGVRDDLVSGNVDPRLLTVLATAAAEFGYTVDEFPRTNGVDDVGMLRTVRISAIDRLAPTGGTDAAADNVLLRDFFRYQLLPYRPLSQGFDDGVLVVTYSAPSPVGLLS